MAKDLTKFRIKGTEQWLPKNRLVLSCLQQFFKDVIVKDYHPNENWPNEIQGSAGIIVALEEVSNERYYFMDDILVADDGRKYVVSNQWGAGNFNGFIEKARTMGYPIEASSAAGNTTTQVEQPATIKTVQDSPENAWTTPHALAFVIRHTMLADGEVIEGELNWMQVAFEEYDEQEIEVRDVWDDVDDQAQLFMLSGNYQPILINCLTYLDAQLDNDQKSRLIQILMQICVQDDLVSKHEYASLLLIAKLLYSAGAPYPIKNVLDNAGIKIEGTDPEQQEKQKLKIEIIGSMYYNTTDDVYSWDADNLLQISMNDRLIAKKYLSEIKIAEEESAVVNNIYKPGILSDDYLIDTVHASTLQLEDGTTIHIPFANCNLRREGELQIEYGKWHLQAELEVPGQFQLSELVFVSLNNLAEAIGSGEPHFASLILYPGVGELVFDVIDVNIKDTYSLVV
jgi:uncharacterized tellurite resistance protein B-like protein